MRKDVFTGAVLALALATGAATAGAQSRSGTMMEIQPATSKLWIEGTSSLHDWSCTAGTVNGSVELDAAYSTLNLQTNPKIAKTVAISVPVKEMKCGHGKMDGNMYKALRADEFPTIEYKLGGYDVTPQADDPASFVMHTRGTLTIAGQTKDVQFDITAHRAPNGEVKVQGSQPIVMTDYDVKPPKAMLGTIKTGKTVTVKFDLLLAPAAAKVGGR
ncbi:MAG TPA: YceI family protein [Gemmatimonadaceae bacterium]